jgi:hypothetical protein
MIWIFVCIFGYFDSWSLCGYIIYSFVGSFVNLCNVTTLIPPASRACCDVHEALGGAFPKRHHGDCGVIAIICKVPILGRHISVRPASTQKEVEGGKTSSGEFKKTIVCQVEHIGMSTAKH